MDSFCRSKLLDFLCKFGGLAFLLFRRAIFAAWLAPVSFSRVMTSRLFHLQSSLASENCARAHRRAALTIWLYSALAEYRPLAAFLLPRPPLVQGEGLVAFACKRFLVFLPQRYFLLMIPALPARL